MNQLDEGIIRCRKSTFSVRLLGATILSALLITGVSRTVYGQASDGAEVRIDVSDTGPRQVEEQTQKSIVRDYAAAWKAFARALEQNNPSALGDLWVGSARENILGAIAEQRNSGLSLRYVDHGHTLNALFYSPEGSAMELHDTAKLERMVVDGSTVISSERITANYIVVMTPTADHWQVRILQMTPGF